MQNESKLAKIKDSFRLHFALLFGTILAFHGTKPPFANEYIYLLRLQRVYNPEFLLNDVSFAVPGNEHWLFNHLFGLLTGVFSIEAISWGGRIVCWSVLLYAVMRLARHWEIPLWMVTASIFIWLCRGQAVVAEEWIFGSFEAKGIAYICLLFALDGFSRERSVYPAILLGLTFSFHPAVGLWGGLAAAIALLFCWLEPLKYVKIGALAVVFALPGLLPMLSEVTKPASVDDWKFVELVRFPHLFDPFNWSKTGIALVFLQLAFCLLFYYFGPGISKRRFLPAFLTALGLFFTAGIFLRVFEQYELLRFMPGRLFPVFAPLFFFFSLAEAYKRKMLGPPLTTIAAIGFVSLLFWQSPLSTATDLVRLNYRSWQAEMDDTAKSFVWIGQNTPNGTTVIAPPWRQDFWYLSHRSQVASSGFPTYVDLGEWRSRVEMLSGESVANRRTGEPDPRPEFYRSLDAGRILEIAARSNAEYLVSDGEYDFPVAFQSGKTRVYRLKP